MLDHCRNSSLEHASGDINNTVKKREGKQLQMKMLAGKQRKLSNGERTLHATPRSEDPKHVLHSRKRRHQPCTPGSKRHPFVPPPAPRTLGTIHGDATTMLKGLGTRRRPVLHSRERAPLRICCIPGGQRLSHVPHSQRHVLLTHCRAPLKNE